MTARLITSNRTAKKNRICICGTTIAAGEEYYAYKTRAASYPEAMHAGTWYPLYRKCGACIEKSNALIATALADASS